MSKPIILIVSYSPDNYAVNAVKSRIDQEKFEVVRFDVDKYLTDWNLSSVCVNGAWNITLHYKDLSYNAKDIVAVWSRRFHDLAKAALDDMDAAYRAAAYEEARITLLGFLASQTQAFHLNHHLQNRVAEIKEWQMQVASQLGLKMPKSCISNDPDTVRQFVTDCNNEVIAKMQGFSRVERDGEELFVMTSKLTPEQLADLDGVQQTPMIFQEFIPKTIEYRTTIVGKKLFTIALDTSKKKIFEVDWRRDAEDSVSYWEKANLPAEIEEKLLAYMDYFYLNYGAADILLSPDGQYYFLETNPGGEFGWADSICKGAIAEQIAAVLMNPTLGRACSPFFNKQ